MLDLDFCKVDTQILYFPVRFYQRALCFSFALGPLKSLGDAVGKDIPKQHLTRYFTCVLIVNSKIYTVV